MKYLVCVLTTLAAAAWCAAPARASVIVNAPRSLGLERGLVGWWTFDGKDMAGNYAFDKSGNGNRGTLTGSNGVPVRTLGKIGQGMQFDGVDDYMDAGDPASLEPGGPMTVSLWFKLTRAAPEYTGPLMKSNAGNTGYGIFFTDDVVVGSTKSIAFFVTEYSQNAGYKAFDYTADRNWHHAVGVYDGQNVQLYLDGAKGTDDPFTGAVTTDAHSLVIGSTDSAFNNPSAMPGLVDDIRIYNRALSADEIKRLYNMGGTVKLNTTANSLTNGLVGWWTFDGKDMSGVMAFDRSGQGNDAALYKSQDIVGIGPVRTVGKIGQALAFDGESQYVDPGAPSSLQLTGSMTISSWVKPGTLLDSNGGFIVSRYNNSGDPSYTLYTVFSSYVFQIRIADSGLSLISRDSVTVAKKDTWYHVVGVYNASAQTLDMYVNGVLDNGTLTGTVPSSQRSNGANVAIGRSPNNFAEFNGLIDDVRIYNRALSADEIKRLYNIGGTVKLNTSASTGSLSQGLVGWWTFDGKDISGVQVYDRSGNGNRGILTSGPVQTIGKIGQGLSFDGGNDTVNAGTVSSFNNMTAISMSAWIKPRTSGEGTSGRIVTRQL